MAHTPWAVRDKLDRDDSATRLGLLEAAQHVFATQGFARTTVADITRTAGVGRATFYVYFASKEEVFAAVATQVRDRLVAAQDLGSTDPDDPVAVARATNAAYLQAYADHLGFLTVLDHQAIADPEMARLREDIHSRPARRAARWVQHLVDRGLAKPAGSPDVIARASGGLVVVFAPMLAQRPDDRDALVADLVALHLRLLGVDE